MNSSAITKGDPVEVKFATHDGYIWRPATAFYVDNIKLTVEYSNGTIEALPHRQDRYRRSENRNAVLT